MLALPVLPVVRAGCHCRDNRARWQAMRDGPPAASGGDRVAVRQTGSTINLVVAFKQEAEAMTRNMGTIDRIVRALAALVIIGLYLTGQLTGLAAIVLGILAAVLILTSAVGWCPLYVPFHLSTRRHA
jgi:hypothetical protein